MYGYACITFMKCLINLSMAKNTAQSLRIMHFNLHYRGN